MDQFEGRVAVVTGAGSGIGEGLANLAHEKGMKVVVSDIEESQAERVAEAIRQNGGEAIAIRTDVSNEDSVKKLADRAFEAFGAVHLLCANAGVLSTGPLLETTTGDWQWMFGVNTFGPIYCAKAFLPRMKEQDGDGHFLITASMAGLYASPDIPIGAYTTSKYAIVGFAEMLRGEVEADGIGVSVLCPGSVTTRIGEAKRNRPDELGGPVTAPPPPNAGRRADAAVQTPVMALSPAETAAVAFEGIVANRMFIPTHSNRRQFVEDRHRQLMDGFDHAR